MVTVQQRPPTGDPSTVHEVKIIECEVYSRVVGYYRPVQQFHAGKRREFDDRHLIPFKKV